MEESMLITGPAGAGKSYMIRNIISKLDPDNTAVTAMTGVAAQILGGTTLHSKLHLPVLMYQYDVIHTDNGYLFRSVLDCAKDLYRSHKKCKKHADHDVICELCRLRNIKHLIIDECSMMSSMIITMLDAILCCIASEEFYKHYKQCIRSTEDISNKLVFGGIQLILVGDVCQLPPIPIKDCNTKVVIDPGMPFFESNLINWHNSRSHRVLRQLSMKILYLNGNYRQAQDIEFNDMLREIRQGRLSKSNIKLLMTCKLQDKLEFQDELRLYPDRDSVAKWNRRKYNLLDPDTERLYKVDIRGFDHTGGQLTENILTSYHITDVKLRVGARVMITRNIDTQWVNGSIATVKNLHKTYITVVSQSVPQVQGIIERFQLLVRDTTLVISYMPLNLAYACTIHKAQGITYEGDICVALPYAWIAGLAYVALSRVRSLDKLHILKLVPNSIKVCPTSLKFDRWAQRHTITYPAKSS